VFLLLASFLLRIIRGPEPPQPQAGQEVKTAAPTAPAVAAVPAEQTQGEGGLE
jgi:hypothetical protein